MRMKYRSINGCKCKLRRRVFMKHKQIEINVEATQGAIEAIEALTQKLLKQIEDAENKGE